MSDIDSLLDLIQLFYLSWGAKIKDLYPDFDDYFSKMLIEEQLQFLVRGHRYQVYEKEYFDKLLAQHNNIFVEVFGISSNGSTSIVITFLQTIPQSQAKQPDLGVVL